MSSASVDSVQLSRGILTEDSQDDRNDIIEMLVTAYWMEIETVMNYVAASINPDGIRAQEIIEALENDIEEELGHARKFGARIKELYGRVPGSDEFKASQKTMQPPTDSTDLISVVRGVIDAETGAIEHYNKVITACEGKDPVTADLVTTILADEEAHRRLFEGFLLELES